MRTAVGDSCGARAISAGSPSSNNHPSSIILHQFPRDYSVWGQVGAWDADHPNPYLFTGRRFDTETGLYYYRARYYHPEIGRFLQTDPIGYDDGINWYVYCANKPTRLIDPTGMLNCPGLPPIPGTDVPISNEAIGDIEDWVRSWSEMCVSLYEWVTGTGPTFPKYSEESGTVALLKNDRRVETARAEFRAMNSGKPRSEWKSFSYGEHFGLAQFWEYNVSPLHIIGGITVHITTGVTIEPQKGPSDSNDRSSKPVLEHIIVTSDMSWESCSRILEELGTDKKPMGGSLERYELRLFGTIHQTWHWYEDVLEE